MKSHILVSVLTIGAALPHSALGQSLEEWKAAWNSAQAGKGCLSLPNGGSFSSFRSDCEALQRKVDEFINNRWNCDGLDTRELRIQANNLSSAMGEWQNERGSLYRERDNLNSELNSLQSQRSSADTDDEKRNIDSRIEQTGRRLSEVTAKARDLDSRIAEKDRILGEMKKKIDESIREIDVRIPKFREHIEDRARVQEIFKKADYAASNVTDAEIKHYSDKLRVYWDDGWIDHAEPVIQARAGLSKCETFKG